MCKTLSENQIDIINSCLNDVVAVIKLFFNNVSKQLQQLHNQNGRLHSLNEAHVITAPKSWGEARLVS